jgi:hypothetical protein
MNQLNQSNLPTVLNLNLPLNSVSFGFVGFNILNTLINKGLPVAVAPINGQIDLRSFSGVADERKQMIVELCKNFPSSYSRLTPAFKLWHINGSEQSVGEGNHLMTFHELDGLTPTEINILNNQKQVFVTSEETKKVFLSHGVKVPVHYIPLGFDSLHFYPTGKTYLGPNTTVWSINGKLEKRKQHHKIIPLWLKKYGNNPQHKLHLSVYNVHMKPEENNQAIQAMMGGKKYYNVSIYPYLDNLTMLNESYNATNIVIDASGAEGWSLPSFHCVGVGKHAVLHDATGISSWASEENACLVKPCAKTPVYDGRFFVEGAPFNQGNIYEWDENEFSSKMDEALVRFRKNPVNEAGLLLRDIFTWDKTVDMILDKVSEVENQNW